MEGRFSLDCDAWQARQEAYQLVVDEGAGLQHDANGDGIRAARHAGHVSDQVVQRLRIEVAPKADADLVLAMVDIESVRHR